MVVAGAGAIEHEELVELTQHAFKNLPTKPLDPMANTGMDPAVFTGSDMRVKVSIDYPHELSMVEG